MNDNDIIHYHATIAQANAMLRKGLITEVEFLRFEEKIRQKYNLPKNSIFRDYHLIYPKNKR